MRELKEAFVRVFKDLAAHGLVEDDETLLQAMWLQFVSDLQRNIYPSKATQ